MTVAAGRRAAVTADVVLAPADADGPPLGEMLWPHEAQYVITSQSPVAGTPVRRFESVVVTFDAIDSDGPDAAGVREPRRPTPPLGDVRVRRLAAEEHSGNDDDR
jgi:hypothetical protein